MNSESEQTPKKSTTVRSLKKLDSICDLFEKRLALGQSPDPMEFLEDVTSSERLVLLRELLALELEYRIKRGETPTRTEYLKKYAEDVSVIHQVFAHIGSGDAGTYVEDGQFDSRNPGAATVDFPAEIGKYRIIGRLDAGGEADVYRAVHPLLTKELVVKLSVDEIHESGHSRLIEEAKILAELEHPNIGRIYDLDIWQNRPFMVMEYVRGLSLADYARLRNLSVSESIAIVERIAEAVYSANRQGVVHRDIKPANIVIDQNGEPKLIDFGLAKINDMWHDRNRRIGFISGSVGYMAPEQASGKSDAVDGRTDVFSLGGVLHFLITGKPPYEYEDFDEGIVAAQRCNISFKEVEDKGGPAVSQIIKRALSKKPEDRFENAQELADALRVVNTRAPMVPRVMAGALVLAVLLAALGWMARNRPMTPNDGENGGDVRIEKTVDEKSRNGSWSVIKRLDEVNAPYRVINFHPEGKFVVTGNAGQQGACWALPHGVFRYATRRPVSEIDGMIYNKQGDQLAVVVRRHRTIELWDARSGQVVRTFTGHADETEGVAFSNDETKLYSTGFDGVVKVWDISTGEAVSEYELRGRLYSIVATPDGNSLFVAGDNGLIFHVDLETENVLEIQGHTGTVRRLALSKDGSRMISCGADSQAVVWNTKSLEIFATLKCPAEFQMDDAVYNAVFMDDGSKALIATNNGKCLVMDVETGQMIDVLDGGKGRCVVGIDATGRQVATATEGDKIKLWALTPGTP